VERLELFKPVSFVVAVVVGILLAVTSGGPAGADVNALK
jgi:hypothetical protein